VNPVNHYIKKINNNERPILQSTYPTKSEQMEEEMFLGLRMNKGVSKNRFFEKFDQTVEQVYEQALKDLTQKGLIVEQGDYISMTDRGKVVGNLVFEAFLLNV
ncbi:coproporphyrinogen III oxidase, partial [Staphylococcus xylosus]